MITNLVELFSLYSLSTILYYSLASRGAEGVKGCTPSGERMQGTQGAPLARSSAAHTGGVQAREAARHVGSASLVSWLEMRTRQTPQRVGETATRPRGSAVGLEDVHWSDWMCVRLNGAASARVVEAVKPKLVI